MTKLTSKHFEKIGFEINNLVNGLLPGQTIEINPDGKIQVVYRDNSGKKHKSQRGILFNTVSLEIDSEVKSMWDYGNNGHGLKSWSKFGDKLPKTNDDGKLDFEKTTYLAMLEMFPNEIKYSEISDQPNYTKYTVKEIMGIQGYFNDDNLVYLVVKGVKHYIPQILPKLDTEIMSYCDDCKQVFKQSDVKPYKVNLEIKCLCKDCLTKYPNYNEVIIK